MYVARYAGEIGGSLGIHGRSNTIQQIANKNKWLLRPRVHTILVNLWQLSTTPPPHLVYFLLANQSLTDASAICCHTIESILPC